MNGRISCAGSIRRKNTVLFYRSSALSRLRASHNATAMFYVATMMCRANFRRQNPTHAMSARPRRSHGSHQAMPFTLCLSRTRTRGTIKVHHFSFEVPQNGSLRHVPPKNWPRNIKKQRPDETSHGHGTRREPRKINREVLTILG